MKKLLVVLCCLVMCLSFAACSNNTATVESYISSIQSDIDTMKESMGISGANLDVTARGNSMVYSFQFTTDVGDTSLIKDSLSSAMDQMASTFENGFQELKAKVSSAESIIVEYLDKDGNVIV